MDCGLYQSVKSPWENYCVNSRKFNFKAREIDAIFVEEAHMDHLGALPILYAHNCDAPIYIPKGNYDIFKVLLTDSAFISQRDVELFYKQRGKNYPPLYTQEDVENCLAHIVEVEIGETIQIDEQTTLQFIGAAHILNAAQIILKIKVGNVTKTIGFTGDVGNIAVKTPYVGQFEPIKKADILLGECTYGGVPEGCKQKDREKDLEKMKTVITETCIENHGRVLIPCFANSRTQTIITMLYDLFGKDKTFKIPVLVDSPMACTITKMYEYLLEGEELEHYKEVLAWENLVLVEDPMESKAWRSSKEPCIACSANGMLTSGRSLGWLSKLLPGTNNYIMFVGYIPTDGGIGIKIKEGKCKHITVSGKRVANRCKIVSLKSFTSHMQYDELLEYYSSVKTPKILLVHGDQDGKIEFAKVLQEKISKKNSTTRVICGNVDYSVTI